MAQELEVRRERYGYSDGRNGQPNSNDSGRELKSAHNGQHDSSTKPRVSFSHGLNRSESMVARVRPNVPIRSKPQKMEPHQEQLGELDDGFTQGTQRADIAVHAGPGAVYYLPPGDLKTENGRKNEPEKSALLEASRSDSGTVNAGSVSPSRSSSSGYDSEKSSVISTGSRTFSGHSDENDAVQLMSPFDFPNTLTDSLTPEQSLLRELMIIGGVLKQLSVPRSYRGDVDVAIPHYDAYNAIWIWMTHSGSSMAIQAKMQDYGQCLGKIFDLEKKKLATGNISADILIHANVIVHSGERKDFCRGRVFRLSTSGKSARVHLIDYGSVEEIPLLNIIFMPNDVINSLPFLAHRAKMREIDYGFEPHDETSFRSNFENVLTESILRGRVVGDVGDFLEIDLDFGPFFRSVGRKLGLEGFQRPLVVLPPRDRELLLPDLRIPVRLMAVESASVMYVWLGSENEMRRDIIEMSKTMKETLGKSPEPLTIPEPGVLVAVQAGSMWCRGRVMSVETDYTCTIFFLDFGRIGQTTFSSVRPLDEDNAAKPAIALRCREVQVATAQTSLTSTGSVSSLGSVGSVGSVDSCAHVLLADYLGKHLTVTIQQFHPASDNFEGGSDRDVADVVLHLPDLTGSYWDALKGLAGKSK